MIDVMSASYPNEFFARYFETETPVVLTGFTQDWPAFGTWSPRHFAERFGDVALEVAERGSSGVRPSEGWKKMRLSVLAQLMTDEPEASVYVVAQSNALAHPGLAELAADIAIDDRFFGSDVDRSALGLWLGPQNTVTPLHRDKTPTVLAQVFGTKCVTLISPHHTDKLYNSHGGYSDVDPDHPDAHSRWPLFADVVLHRITLQAGDALFIPARWWHHVRSLSASASVSIGRFAERYR